VEYEELPTVFDEVEAMTSKAVVHEVLKPAGTFPDLKHLEGRRDTNIALDFHLRRGDVTRGFAEADRIFEHSFRTQQVLHVPLEPFVSVAEPAGDSLTLHTSSQTPSFVRLEIARLLGWPESRVRVRVPHLGGGFGAKVYVKLESARDRPRAPFPPAGEDRTVDGGAVLHHHQACHYPAHQERRNQGWPDQHARVRGMVGTAARTPTSDRASPRNRGSPHPVPTTSST
jgi:hypothetical protein